MVRVRLTSDLAYFYLEYLQPVKVILRVAAGEGKRGSLSLHIGLAGALSPRLDAWFEFGMHEFWT